MHQHLSFCLGFPLFCGYHPVIQGLPPWCFGYIHGCSHWNNRILAYHHTIYWPGRIVQSVTCLTADSCLTADPGVVSLILAQSHTFMEIDHEVSDLGPYCLQYRLPKNKSRWEELTKVVTSSKKAGVVISSFLSSLLPNCQWIDYILKAECGGW